MRDTAPTSAPDPTIAADSKPSPALDPAGAGGFAEAPALDTASAGGFAEAEALDPVGGMGSARRWRRRFEAEVGAHGGLAVAGDVAPSSLDPAVVAALGPSLATFQVGESGTGDHLLAAADDAGADPDLRRALELFVVEEQEHARLLGLVLDALGHPHRQGHWTDRVFVVLRRSRSYRAEVLTLLVAEVIALRYYSALRDGVPDDALRDVFGRIHADEVRHVAFHGATLPPYLARFGRPARAAARLAWNTIVTGASIVVAIDHGSALRAVGLGRRRFVIDVWALRRDLDHRLFLGPIGDHAER